MNKSIDFVKQRIRSGCYGGMENNKYESMIELSFADGCKMCEFDFDKSHSFVMNTEHSDGTIKNFHMTITHDVNANFGYFTMERCSSDGTYLHYYELIRNVLLKLLKLTTCDTRVEIPSDLSGHEIKYTVGNFVLAGEYGDEFATKEKPWMKSRFSVMLPIKFEVI